VHHRRSADFLRNIRSADCSLLAKSVCLKIFSRIRIFPAIWTKLSISRVLALATLDCIEGLISQSSNPSLSDKTELLHRNQTIWLRTILGSAKYWNELISHIYQESISASKPGKHLNSIKYISTGFSEFGKRINIAFPESKRHFWIGEIAMSRSGRKPESTQKLREPALPQSPKVPHQQIDPNPDFSSANHSEGGLSAAQISRITNALPLVFLWSLRYWIGLMVLLTSNSQPLQLDLRLEAPESRWSDDAFSPQL